MDLKRFLGNVARTFLATGALSVSAFAVADDSHMAGCSTAPAACNTCCCGEPCCAPPVCGNAYNPPGYCRCNNPASCCDSCSDGLTARVDFLWWRAYEDNLALGAEETFTSFVNNGSTTTVHSSVLNTEHIKDLDFKYEPGFRLGLYDVCATGCWDIGLIWTHFHSTSTANESVADTSVADVTFVPFWERQSGLLTPSSVSGKYALNMDLLDLEFGRKFYVSSCFVLRPHFGLRGARINQSYRIESVRTATTPVLYGEAYASEVKTRNDFLAIGPRVGLEAQVHLGCGFSIFGEAAGSLVFGRFDRHSSETYADYLAPTATTLADDLVNNYDFDTEGSLERSSRSFTDLTIGIKWERCFDWCNRLHPVSVAFSWEHHGFYNMNNFNFISAGVSGTDATPGAVGTFTYNGAQFHDHGDLTTQGLTVSLAVGF